MSHDDPSELISPMAEGSEKRERSDVHKNVLDVNADVNPILTEKMLDLLLKGKTDTGEERPSLDGFVQCYLIIQSLHSSSEKVKFRLKLEWTGSEVKQEIHRLYAIPTNFQVLLINDKTVSDQQLIGNEMFDFKPIDQLITVFLVKNMASYDGSAIRVKDILENQDEAAGSQETVPSNVYDDFNDDASNSSVTSQSSNASSRKKDKRRQKRR